MPHRSGVPRRLTASVLAAVLLSGLTAVGCSREPKTAADVLARSVAAHGGDRLTDWRTLEIRGNVVMQDGIAYNAAFRLLARPSGQIRVDQDLTADRGRAFYEYFLDDGVAWTRRNLVVSPYDAARMRRWLNHCYLVAFYAKNATELELKPDGEATPVGPASPGEAAQMAPVPTWVVAGKVGEDAVELYIAKQDYRLLREVTPFSTRDFGAFRTFQGVVWPTRIVERTKTRQREIETPFTYTSVIYDAPIDDWLFREDRPKGR
ncbi:MAG: hypothetical protein AB1806_06390 [Acidobacteriota bacterium]